MSSKILIFLAALGACLAQDAYIICDYFDYQVNGTDVYACHLRVRNFEGREFPRVEGEHLPGRTDADVGSVIAFTGTTTNVPLVICEQFANLAILDLSFLHIAGIASNAFSACANLHWLRLHYNDVAALPSDVFANNTRLTYLDLDMLGLAEIHADVFVPLAELETLEMASNPLRELPAGLFRAQARLSSLYLSSLQLRELPAELLASLENLAYLTLFNNRLTTLPDAAFDSLRRLEILDIGGNDFGDNLPASVFARLASLEVLSMSDIGVRRLNPQWFAALANVHQLSLSLNLVDDLPAGVFGGMPRIERLSLWSNRVKAVGRDAFGNVTALRYLDLESNVVNSMEERLFEEAENLQSLYFNDNFCASGFFFGFQANRENFMARLGRCFRNFGFTVDTETEVDAPYQFFAAPSPGIHVRVQAEGTIQIALTPFDFPWTPMLEVVIGAANNTRSVIRRNQETDVVTVPTPGIVRSGELNGFRVRWGSHILMVFREGEQWPFMAYTMQDFFNINFYGLRSPASTATWSIAPVDRDDVLAP